jgi:hypothetical protein
MTFNIHPLSPQPLPPTPPPPNSDDINIVVAMKAMGADSDQEVVGLVGREEALQALLLPSLQARGGLLLFGGMGAGCGLWFAFFRAFQVALHAFGPITQRRAGAGQGGAPGAASRACW